MHLELPIVSFLSAALSLAPLPWHWRAGTLPTIAIALWLFISNIIDGVNSIIWAGNVRITALLWCDISSKIFIGANVALPASIFCLCIHLERVSSIRNVSTNHAQKRRRLYLDAFCCFGIPVLYMALHYVVQGHRFDVIEDFGCRANTYVSVPSIFLIWVPPLFFSLGAFILSGLAFRNFWIRRLSFARHLQSNSALTPSRYFRLMAMSLVQMFWGLFINILNMWFTMRTGLRPWISWQDVHFNFSRVAVYPTIFIPQKDLFFTYLLWWTLPISTFFFFVFFAFGRDAVKEYLAVYLWLKRAVSRLPRKSEKASLVLPLHDDMITLPSFSKSDNDWKPEDTFASASLSTKGYQWHPPPSPSPSSCPTYYPPSPTEVPSPGFKHQDFDSKSFSTDCSTVRP